MLFTRLSPQQDRALHELREGRPLILGFQDGPDLLCWAMDTSRHMVPMPHGQILLSGARAQALGLGTDPIAVPVDPAAGTAQFHFLMHSNTQISLQPVPAPTFLKALIGLAKQGRLIPAFYTHPIQGGGDRDYLRLPVQALHLKGEQGTLHHISTAPLPLNLKGQEVQTTAILFGINSLHETALILNIGDPHRVSAPLVRLHSACLTGDVFGSLRCDCGPQLQHALLAMVKEGQGCLLYLPQEGRDTGLSNKLRAYALQDSGLDTIDADMTLGFEADERDFALAAALLQKQGLPRVRLLTNNPAKVKGLEDAGVSVEARVPLQIPPQRHNKAYLKTKAQRAGHDLDI